MVNLKCAKILTSKKPALGNNDSPYDYIKNRLGFGVEKIHYNNRCKDSKVYLYTADGRSAEMGTMTNFLNLSKARANIAADLGIVIDLNAKEWMKICQLIFLRQEKSNWDIAQS